MQRISSCYIISFERLFAFFRARRAGRLRVSRRSALHSKLGLPYFSNKKSENLKEILIFLIIHKILPQLKQYFL